jgi:hypothetical protein
MKNVWCKKLTCETRGAGLTLLKDKETMAPGKWGGGGKMKDSGMSRKRKIFEQEQIAGAVQLGLGAASSSEIDLVPGDARSREYCTRVEEMPAQG